MNSVFLSESRIVLTFCSMKFRLNWRIEEYGESCDEYENVASASSHNQ